MELELKGLVEVTTVVGKDGRITIPLKIREQLGINQGDAIKMVASSDVVTFIVIK